MQRVFDFTSIDVLAIDCRDARKLLKFVPYDRYRYMMKVADCLSVANHMRYMIGDDDRRLVIDTSRVLAKNDIDLDNIIIVKVSDFSIDGYLQLMRKCYKRALWKNVILRSISTLTYNGRRMLYVRVD